MVVEPNLASLYEKLKVDDRFLPPRPWESIPSESGLCHSRSRAASSPSSQHRLFDISTVSEASLVRLALNALQGLESAIISIEKLSAAFCSDPADRTVHGITDLWSRSSSTHALGKILKSIGFCGFLVFLLKKFVEYFSNLNLDGELNGRTETAHLNMQVSQSQEGKHDEKAERELLPFGLVNQAFAGALGKILDGYACALNTLCSSVGLRRSPTVTLLPNDPVEIGCLSTVVHSKVTLLEVYLHTEELRTRIEALACLCNLLNVGLCFSQLSFETLTAKAVAEFFNFPRGGDLLTYLYKELQVADPPYRSLLKFLLVRSCEPYFEFVRSWIYKAEINDPYEEFLLGSVHDPVLRSDGKPGYVAGASFQVRDEAAVPCFLKELLVPIVRAGQQLQVLIKIFEWCSYVALGNNTYDEFFPCWKEFLDSSFSSPLVFNKRSIEALVIARTNYYNMMQEKLEKVSTNFEFRHQQVVSFGAIPLASQSCRSEALSMFNDCFTASPAADQEGVGDMASHSCTSCGVDAFDWSDCSSSDYSDEQIELKELIQLPNDLSHPEQNHFYALQFPLTSHEDNLLRRNQVIFCNRNNSEDAFVSGVSGSSYPRSSHKSVSGELNQSVDSSNLRRDGPAENGSADVPFCSNSCLQQSDSNLVTNRRKSEVTEGNALFRGNFSPLPSVVEGILRQNEPVKACLNSDLFKLQSLDIGNNLNFLSMNPMLSSTSFRHSMRKSGSSWSNEYRISLPYFEFSSVEDAISVCVEKLPAQSTCENDSRPPVMANPNAPGVSGDHGEKTRPGKMFTENIWTDLEVKDQNQEDTPPANVTGGSSWQSLLGSCRSTVINTAREQKQISFDTFEIPVDFIMEKCLLQEIWLQYKYVSRLTIKLFEDGFNLQEHLLTLRRYNFMGVADWADLFIMSLWHQKWFVSEAVQRVSVIQGLLETAIQRSSCESDGYKERLFVYVKEHGMTPVSTSAIGIHSFDFLGLGYHVDWPVSIILTPAALKIYSEIFNFLIKVKLAVYSLTDIWCLFKDSMHPGGRSNMSPLQEKEVKHVKALMNLWHQFNHFVSMLQQYVQSQLSHVSWCRLLHSLKHKVKDLMDLEYAHMVYLRDSLHICFLSDETQDIGNIIKNILQCALDYRFCLIRTVQDCRDGADLSEKLSVVDISLVQSIKKRFDKNMEELHLLYLRSPKHGKFGLSHFWGFLNYNGYYSDRANEKGFFF